MAEMNRPDRDDGVLERLAQPTGRRSFLKWSGVGALGLVAAACEREQTRTITEIEVRTDTLRIQPPPPPTFQAVTIDFAQGDIAILNFAFALEQLEAAFYTQAVANPYQGINDAERRLLTDLRDHEVIHREFYRAAIRALGGTPLPNLTPNFESVDFTNRTSVLTFARNFEDTGVGAYNGAGQFITNPAVLTVAGKVVSVEARHVSALDDLLSPGIDRAFARRDIDHALPPGRVLATVAPFVRNRITVANVPGNFVSADRRA
jgi:hypothetical protein